MELEMNNQMKKGNGFLFLVGVGVILKFLNIHSNSESIFMWSTGLMASDLFSFKIQSSGNRYSSSDSSVSPFFCFVSRYHYYYYYYYYCQSLLLFGTHFESTDF